MTEEMTKNQDNQVPAALYTGDEKKVSFHSIVHGGEYACIGMYEDENTSIFDANHRTVAFVASMVDIDNSTQILDIGAGYGGAAHYLAKTFGCKVFCLNINPAQNEVNQQKIDAMGLNEQVSVITGSYENIEGLVESNCFDIVWSQDAMFFSRFPELIFKGVKYALKPQGKFIFSDLMKTEKCSSDMLATILDVQKIDSLCSANDYKSIASQFGFKQQQFIDMPQQLINHYSRVIQSVDRDYEFLLPECGKDFLDYHRLRVSTWIEGTKKGHFNWAILQFQLED